MAAVGGRALPGRRLRVMVVGDHLGYPGGVLHGVTTYYLDVLPALAAAGVELTVCFLREPHQASESLRGHGISVLFLSAARGNPLVALQLAAIARRQQCSILHAAGIKATLMARLATRLVPARTILHVHDLIYPGRAVGLLHRMFARKSDMAVVVSQAAATVAIEGYHVSRDRVRVVPNGIRLERFKDKDSVPGGNSALRASLGIDASTRVLGLIGRMYPIKGHRALLRMMPKIMQRCPEVLLLLAGDGPEREPCERLVQDLRIQRNVRFLGQLNDVRDVLAACDVVVVPSESEGLSLAAIEAMAMSRPVVAFDSGGIKDVIDDGVSGHLVSAGNADAFADAVLSLLLDCKKRAAFGANAARAAERFSLEGHVQRMLACYRELDARSGSGN